MKKSAEREIRCIEFLFPRSLLPKSISKHNAPSWYVYLDIDCRSIRDIGTIVHAVHNMIGDARDDRDRRRGRQRPQKGTAIPPGAGAGPPPGASRPGTAIPWRRYVWRSRGNGAVRSVIGRPGSRPVAGRRIPRRTLTRGAVISGAVVAGAIVSGSVVAGALTAGAIITGAIVSGAVIAGALTAGAIITGAVVPGAVIPRTLTAGTVAARS